MRRRKDEMLKPLALKMRHVSPNVISLVALVVGFGAAALVAREMYFAALILWFVNRLLDGLDGLVARQHTKQRDFGGYVDILADFAVYAAIPIGLFLAHPTIQFGISLAILQGSFYVNAASWMFLSSLLEKRSAGAKASEEQTAVIIPRGLIEGTETILFYTAFLLWPQIAQWLFLVMAGLVFVGIVLRIGWAYRNLNERPTQKESTYAATNPVAPAYDRV